MEKLKKPSVLVIDDDLMMREMLKLILRSDDYDVVGEASNGEDGISLCAQLKPALVLLDINMPKMDGLQALEGIRKANPAAKILMVTADTHVDKVREAIRKGASGFIVKPLSQASVLDKVAACCKRKV